MKEYRGFCSLFYAAHYLPIALYDGNGFVCSAGFPDGSDPYPFVLPKLTALGNPAVYVSSDTGYYGLVRCDDAHFFVLGPAYSTSVTEEIISAYIKKNAISLDRRGETAQFLSGISTYTYNQFLNLLLYLLYTLTGEQKTVAAAFTVTNMGYQEQIGRQHTETSYEARDDQIRHGSYHFEQQMLEVIRGGDVAKLNQFLMTTLKAVPLKEGKLADTPLRQAKNLLIGTVSMVGKDAAIPAGLDVEETYRLIDTYIQECERLQSEEAVKNLQYNMLIDFTQRIAQHRIPPQLSPEVFSCIQFISTHVNEPIGVAEVMAHSGRSRACLFKKFQQELGTTISAYMMDCRLREARSLLRYTEKSLREISSYLCFSSQSHFQSVFKKQYGITPLEYRKGVDEKAGLDYNDVML